MNRGDSPEFTSPSLNAYYQIPCGSNSCFGDQAFVVLQSLVRCGAVNTSDLVASHVQKFGTSGEYGPLGNTNVQSAGDLPIKGPWRHGSVDRFLRNIDAGAGFPRCGSNDGSSDCFVKAVPAIALFAGRAGLKSHVSKVVRVTQNHATAVGFSSAAAEILEQIIMTGSHGQDAIHAAVDRMLRSGSEVESSIGAELSELLDLQDVPYLEAVKTYSGGRYNAV